MGLPPSFRTFHSNQQQHATMRPMYQPQVPFPFNSPWPNMPNQPMGSMMPNNNIYADQKRGARDRARSVDTGGRLNPAMRVPNMFQQQLVPTPQPQQQQPPVPVMEPKVHHHHHHHHHRHRSHHTGQSVSSNKEQSVVSVKTFFSQS